MKSRVIVLFAVGLVVATANPANAKQTLPENNLPLSESSDSETIHRQNTLNKGETEQKQQETNANGNDIIADKSIDNVDVIIEDIIPDESIDYFPQAESDIKISDIDEGAISDDVQFENELISKIKDEIMVTAAGLVPIPIIRKKNRMRNPFANRRHFRRNPPMPYHRRQHIRPYYYGYYYHPSSLRFYY